MSDLFEKLTEIEAQAAQIRREIAQGPCREYGHSWKFLGGANAGCGLYCSCSVSVHQCEKCGDCDYGENAEAEEVRRQCVAMQMDVAT
jgi:hypothetical protein